MNLLGLVFSMMMILSYASCASFNKYLGASKLRKAYAANHAVSREILNCYASDIYNNNLSGKASTPKKEKLSDVETEPEGIEEEVPNKTKTPELNRHCAKINLWPLIQEGRKDHPVLYELAAKLIRTFYEPLSSQKNRFEYYFLDTLLKSAKTLQQEDTLFVMEKITLIDPDLQKIYYKMLKGTKNCDLRNKRGYPPLLDYVKAEPSKEKICVFHAHPDLITVLFNEDVAWHLYWQIHQKNPPALTAELIEKATSEMHQIGLDQELIKLLQLGHPHHEEHKKAFVAEDEKGDIFLRKNIYIKI